MAVGPARARECRPKRSLSWAVMVGGSGSRTAPRAYAALMLQSISGFCWGNSSNEPLVRDRGVGGSNPLAPTNSTKILGNLRSSVWQFTRFWYPNWVQRTECSVLQTMAFPGIVRHFQRRVTARTRRHKRSGSNPYAHLMLIGIIRCPSQDQRCQKAEDQRERSSGARNRVDNR